jgi:glycosyltransferase involved in cell wall biosynthesis
MNNVRILMFGWEFPPHNSGGLGVACAGLVTALGEEGVSVTFVLPKTTPVPPIPNVRFRFADQVPGFENMFRISTLAYETASSYTQKLRAQGLSGSLYDTVRAYASAAKIIAASEDFDIIHAHDWLSFGAGLGAKEASGKPLVAHVHATEDDRTGGATNPLIETYEREGLQLADQVITVSNFTKSKVNTLYNIPKKDIEVVHNGLAPGNISCPTLVKRLTKLKASGHHVVLFVGRITLQKGPDYFVKAAKTVIESLPKTLFIMAGSGDMQANIMQESARLGLAEHFFFPGFVRGKELHTLYDVADVYVMPSVSEPFGIVALEALAHNTPTIVSKQSGAAEVLRHALKVDFWDTKELTSLIITTLRDPHLAKQLGERGGKEARSTTWTKAAKRCKNIYTKIIKRIRPPEK